MAASLDGDDDLKLVKASAGLLADLETSLPKVLWKQPKHGAVGGRVHTCIKRRDLDHVTKLIEPFQGEPQLLDTRLKHIVPDIVAAYLEYLQLPGCPQAGERLDLQSGVCTVLYTLAKVRGYRIIVGFFNNEPRYFELVLSALERTVSDGTEAQCQWQVPYVLSLWLSHLLLAPFDLASISSSASSTRSNELDLPVELSPVALRIVTVGLHYLSAPTKTQDAVAAMLTRLVIRPDMQKVWLAKGLVDRFARILAHDRSDVSSSIYEQLGPLRFLTGIASSPELSHLAPIIFRLSERLASNESNTTLGTNALAKKLLVKIFRSVGVLSLRAAPAFGPLLSFLESTSVLENVIDYLLRWLGDRDTPVRYAVAKAIGVIVLNLDPAMGHEVIQAVLDTFKEDMPSKVTAVDYRTANPLRWHGLTLALGHALFKRSAAVEQLPDILDALVSALNFEQRTATGSNVGTNVRDAANFGIWSVSRRYTSNELLAVDAKALRFQSQSARKGSVIQALAIQLILSACLDPAGNIRRGSSAALQELVGRHPDQVHDGIALVQIIDYQAVGLRRRAMVDVACSAARLDHTYSSALLDALLGWRGVGSADVLSRESAAASLAQLSAMDQDNSAVPVANKVASMLNACLTSEVETLHGLVQTLAQIAADALSVFNSSSAPQHRIVADVKGFWAAVVHAQVPRLEFTPRTLRSELLAAAARLAAAVCNIELHNATEYGTTAEVPMELDEYTDRLLARQEDTLIDALPPLVKVLLALKRKAGYPLGGIGAQNLVNKGSADASKSTLSGAGRAVALGALAWSYENGLRGEKARSSIGTLCHLVHAISVDWRVVGVKALQLAAESIEDPEAVDPEIVNQMCGAIHRGLNDYTIDERGDIGSLVRLQAIACTYSLFEAGMHKSMSDSVKALKADIVRLSLAKLDRVRLQAAQCRREYLSFELSVLDVASVSSEVYFRHALGPLFSTGASPETQRALLEGCVSCTGTSAEPLLYASRTALLDHLNAASDSLLSEVLWKFSIVLKDMVKDGSNTHPALELLTFLLDMQLAQRLVDSGFQWRGLLSIVQKSHYKSNDIPKILTAVHVYRGLAEVQSIRLEVLKKLISMLRTNRYPRVRHAVAETLFIVTKEQAMKSRDWNRTAAQNADIIQELQTRYVGS